MSLSCYSTANSMTEDNDKPKVTKLGRMQKSIPPVSGSNYLAWVSDKGVLSYTIDGAALETFQDLPKDTEFEFFEDSIVAIYRDMWISQIVPGEDAIPINRETLVSIRMN